MSTVYFNWAFLFDEKLVDVSDIADGSARKRRLARGGEGNGGGQRQVEGDPVRQYRPVDELAHGLVQAGRLRQVPRYLGRTPGSRHQTQEGRPPVRLRARPRLRRQPRLAVSAAVVVRRARGRGGRQDHGHRLRRDRAGGRYCRKLYKETMFEECLGWTDVNNNKAYLSEQISCTNNAKSILYIAKQDFPDIAKVIGQSQNPKGPKGRFHMLNPLRHSIFTHTPDQQAAKDFLVWLMAPSRSARGTTSPSATTAVPARLRRRADVEGGAAQPALSRLAQDLASAGLAGAAQPGAVGERGEVRRRRHVRQGLRRQVDQGRHRRRQRRS